MSRAWPRPTWAWPTLRYKDVCYNPWTGPMPILAQWEKRQVMDLADQAHSAHKDIFLYNNRVWSGLHFRPTRLDLGPILNPIIKQSGFGQAWTSLRIRNTPPNNPVQNAADQAQVHIGAAPTLSQPTKWVTFLTYLINGFCLRLVHFSLFSPSNQPPLTHPPARELVEWHKA